MAEAARSDAESIRLLLERADGHAISHLQMNLPNLFRNMLVLVETTPDVQSAANDAQHEASLLLDQYAGALGSFDRGPGSEAQRQRAIQAVQRLEKALIAAKPSSRATMLGLA